MLHDVLRRGWGSFRQIVAYRFMGFTPDYNYTPYIPCYKKPGHGQQFYSQFQHRSDYYIFAIKRAFVSLSYSEISAISDHAVSSLRNNDNQRSLGYFRLPKVELCWQKFQSLGVRNKRPQSKAEVKLTGS